MEKGEPIEVRYLLKRGRFGYIGTSDEKGVPHITPVIFVYIDGYIFFATSKKSKKIKNIKENEKVAFLIDERDPTNLSRNIAVLIRGKAKIYDWKDLILHPVQSLRAWKSFRDKYSLYLEFYKKEEEKIPEAWQATPWSRQFVRIQLDNVSHWRVSESWE